MPVTGGSVIEDLEPPAWIISQIMNEEDRKRMRQNYRIEIEKRNAAAQARRSPPPLQQEYIPPQPQYNDPGMQTGFQPAPPPAQDATMNFWMNIAGKGMQMFENWQAQRAARLSPTGPSLAEIAGQRAIANFIDGLSKAQGKATGEQIGKYTKTNMENHDQDQAKDYGMDGALLAVKTEMEQQRKAYEEKTREMDIKAKEFSDIIEKMKGVA